MIVQSRAVHRGVGRSLTEQLCEDVDGGSADDGVSFTLTWEPRGSDALTADSSATGGGARSRGSPPPPPPHPHTHAQVRGGRTTSLKINKSYLAVHLHHHQHPCAHTKT